jgi:PAS domain S-box-containing protein
MDETDEVRGRPARLGEAELRAVLEGLPDATVAANVHGRIVFVNGRAEELFGYSSGELLGRPVDMIWPERVRERYMRNMRLYFETEHPLRFTSEARGLRCDGSEFVGEMSWGTVETSDGRLLLAIGRDISARREALARLQRQSDQQAVVAHLGERALSGDDLRALSSEAVERLCETPGIARAVVTAGTAADTLASCGNRVQGKILELELRTASRLLGTLAVEAERELDDDQRSFLRAIAHVLTLAAERTAGEERLRQAQKMAAVGRLAGGVAHDFNNLLTAISGYVAIARAQVGAGAGARELAEAERATERAAEVTRQLLAVSRRQVLEPALVDLGAVAEELAPMLRRLIGAHVEVSLALADGLAPVLADRGQLAQVLLNLAVNAGDAMPAGGTLTIATARLDDGEVGFVVTDTGHGMPPDVLEHAFEPFFTTKAPGHGTGLGLATVHGIVDQSGGSVTVRSAPGEGAEFTVTFPSAARGPAVGERPAPAEAGRVDGDETVLLCEDATAVRQLLEHVLAANGYRVLPAALPSEAIEIALTHPGRIDALLTDVIMPEMAGPELAEQVRAVRPGLPTLFVSGYTAETLSSRGGLPPGSAFVEKPFAAATLLQALRGLLDQSPA